MKIGIYTLPFTWNYGGILQNYALQKFLEAQGYDVQLIYRRKDTGSRIKNFLKWIKWSLIPLAYKLGIRKEDPLVCCEAFKQKYMSNRSPLMFKTHSLYKYCLSEHFDCVIVGSDQIWRYGNVQDIYDSFLRFVPDGIKRIAYAVSFGVDKWTYSDDATDICKDLVRKIELVTVRESSGVCLCSNYLNKEAYWVLDPTLLMGKKLFVNFHKGDNNKGLFHYMLDINQAKLNMIDDICKSKGWEAYSVLDGTCKDREVSTWIDSIASSNFVLTDSFHGTCFAIIFNKPFIAIYNKERGNARFESLLGGLNLMDRLVDEGADITNLVDAPIDFNQVNLKLNNMREFSSALLINALKSKNN